MLYKAEMLQRSSNNPLYLPVGNTSGLARGERVNSMFKHKGASQKFSTVGKC